MKKYLLILITIILSNIVFAQSEKDTKIVQHALNAKQIIWDEYNGDGVLKAQNKKTGKWGMYQYWFNSKKPEKLVLMKYDSLGFYTHTSSYTIVKNNNKYGVLGSAWEGIEPKTQVKCLYQMLRYVRGSRNIIAAKGNNKWGYVSTETGDTLIPFAFNKFSDLPMPHNNFKEHPMKEYPKELQEVIDNAKTIKEIDLRRLGLTFIPKEIGQCVNATMIDLSGNNLSFLPESFFNLTKLEKLYLGGNPDIHEIGPEYAKLINLKVLYVNYSYSGYYTHAYLKFSDELSKLTNLETLAIRGNFFNSDNDLPDFIYKLPNLKDLTLETFVNRNFAKVDFSKLACKDSLTKLHVSFINDFSNFNSSFKQFPNLSSLIIETAHNTTTPTFINDLQKLYFIRIIYYTPSKKEEGRYNGETVLEIDGNGYKDVVVTAEEKVEALEEWAQFLKEEETE